MARSAKKAEISPERLAEISADAHSGRNWASESPVRPACLCGAGSRTQDAAQALKGLHGRPSGLCPRHPGGSVWVTRPGLWEEIKKGGADGGEEADGQGR